MTSQSSNDNSKNLLLVADNKKKQTSSFKLAPIPTTSPWKSPLPNSSVVRPIEELKDISKASKPNKMGSGSIKVMSNTKWTPITPSVTISGSKDTNSKSGNDHRNVKSNRKTKKRGSNNSNISEKVFNGESSAPYEIHTICNAKPKYFDTNAKANTYLSSGTTTDVNNKKIANGESSPNGKQLKNFQNKYSRTRYNNENHSSRYNKITHYDGYFSSSRPSKSCLLYTSRCV